MVTQLSQDALERDFDSVPIQLRHLWIDLRHVTFTVPPPKPKTVKKTAKKKAKKKSTSKRKQTTKKK